MPFDAKGARAAGYSDAEIAQYLAQQNGFDFQGAVKAGYTPEDILKYLNPGKRDALAAGMTTAGAQLKSGLPYAIEKLAGTLTPEKEEKYLAGLREAREKAEEQLPGGAPSIEDLAQGNAGLGALLLENLAVSAPQMGASIVGGLAGAAAGTVVAPGAGTLAGGVIGVLGGTAASTPFFVGSNVDRATEGGEKKLTKGQAAKSVAVAPVQAGVETVAERFVPGVGRLFGAPVKKVVGEAATKAASKPVQTFLTQTAKGAVKGAAEEAITEPLQQVGERFAAELPLADEEARKEYLVSGLTAGLVGAPVGAVGAQFERKIERPTPGAPATAMGLSPEEGSEPTAPGADQGALQREYLRLYGEELARVQTEQRAQNPDATQKDLDKALPREKAVELVEQARANLAATQPGETGAGAPAEGGMGVGEGPSDSVSPPTEQPAAEQPATEQPAAPIAPEGDEGGLGDFIDNSVPPTDVKEPSNAPVVGRPPTMAQRKVDAANTVRGLLQQQGLDINEKSTPFRQAVNQIAQQNALFDSDIANPLPEPVKIVGGLFAKAGFSPDNVVAPSTAPVQPVPPKTIPSLEQAEAATVETPLAPTAAPAPAPVQPAPAPVQPAPAPIQPEMATPEMATPAQPEMATPEMATPERTE